MLTAKSTRAGRFIRQPTGYDAFIPAPLPPEPPLELQGDVAVLLAGASVALGRLDGILGILPNPDLFVAMYVRQEAVLSSQIEGTQASLAMFCSSPLRRAGWATWPRCGRRPTRGRGRLKSRRSRGPRARLRPRGRTRRP